MTLDEVISNVVCNKDVRNLLTQPYGEIVQFQIKECVNNGTSIDQEGFQIGEPFDGDIENAPILFLSSNPAFNFDEVSPRYFAASGKVFKPEHVSVKKRVKFSDLSKEYSFEDVKKMFTEPQKQMSPDDIKDFLKNRFQISPARDNEDQTLRIPLRYGGTIAVPYWSCVKNNTELLLPTDLKNTWACLNPSQRAREIMKYAVCMEIVPFKSNSEIGVNDELLDKCWTNFTEHLLELSAASVIVLVGDKVLRSFVKHIDPKAEKILRDKNIYSCKIGGKDRKIVKVDFAQGQIRRFENFFDNSVIEQLQKAVADAL